MENGRSEGSRRTLPLFAAAVILVVVDAVASVLEFLDRMLVAVPLVVVPLVVLS